MALRKLSNEAITTKLVEAMDLIRRSQIVLTQLVEAMEIQWVTNCTDPAGGSHLWNFNGSLTRVGGGCGILASHKIYWQFYRATKTNGKGGKIRFWLQDWCLVERVEQPRRSLPWKLFLPHFRGHSQNISLAFLINFEASGTPGKDSFWAVRRPVKAQPSRPFNGRSFGALTVLAFLRYLPLRDATLESVRQHYGIDPFDGRHGRPVDRAVPSRKRSVIYAAVETSLVGIVRHRRPMAAHSLSNGVHWQSILTWSATGGQQLMLEFSGP
ncbi:hypothetical protein B0H13DRAFT_1913741 [Mycena leptocephala]|nr:hypothetical protein B0H13DRAFT_1913741 [Mycena leptocephala]